MAGDPDVPRSLTALRAVAAAGADVIELGVPFSDPMADGRAIQLAAIRALAVGTYLDEVFSVVRAFRAEYDAPLLLMTYYNPILQYGLAKACATAAEAGVDGFLITDLPPEEAGDWLAAAKPYALDTIFLLAPTTPDHRVRLVTEQGGGFVYCISRLGVTGARAELPPDVFALVDHIKTLTDRPVAVGFGISTPDQVSAVCRHADGVIIGSVLVQAIADNADGDLAAAVTPLVTAWKRATVKTG
jgi:tryptophan synthase alpha chain